MYAKKTESPANGIQIYIDGKRFRSLFSAACDTALNLPYLTRIVKATGGAPIILKHKKNRIVTEKWALTHPQFILDAAKNSVQWEVAGGNKNE